MDWWTPRTESPHNEGTRSAWARLTLLLGPGQRVPDRCMGDPLAGEREAQATAPARRPNRCLKPWRRWGPRFSGTVGLSPARPAQPSGRGVSEPWQDAPHDSKRLGASPKKVS